jgi:hypothetical protein
MEVAMLDTIITALRDGPVADVLGVAGLFALTLAVLHLPALV